MIFVDTNYFLRFLLKDVAAQHSEVRELFYQGAAGEVELFSSTVVFFEIYWVLESVYGKHRHELVSVLEKVLQMQFIWIDGRKLLESALVVFAKSSVSLEDAYNVVYARSRKAIKFATFDKKLQKQFHLLS